MNIVERATELMTSNYSNMDYLIVPLNDSDAVLVTVFDESLSSESKKPKKVHSGDLIFLVNPRLQEEAENSVVLVDFSGTAIEVLSK